MRFPCVIYYWHGGKVHIHPMDLDEPVCVALSLRSSHGIPSITLEEMGRKSLQLGWPLFSHMSDPRKGCPVHSLRPSMGRGYRLFWVGNDLKSNGTQGMYKEPVNSFSIQIPTSDLPPSFTFHSPLSASPGQVSMLYQCLESCYYLFLTRSFYLCSSCYLLG